MSVKIPLVLAGNGQIEQLQSGDTLSGGSGSNQLVTSTNFAGATAIGAPMTWSSANTLTQAQANGMPTAHVMGLAAAATGIMGAGSIVTEGDMTLTTAQWDAITGGTGGLTPGNAYYLDPTTAGKLTMTVPFAAGQCVTRVGRALSSTVMSLQIQYPVLL